jgi:hypothetical protein
VETVGEVEPERGDHHQRENAIVHRSVIGPPPVDVDRPER